MKTYATAVKLLSQDISEGGLVRNLKESALALLDDESSSLCPGFVLLLLCCCIAAFSTFLMFFRKWAP